MNSIDSKVISQEQSRDNNVLQTGIIDHRYKIVKELGRGGMGRVFLVEDRLSNYQQLTLKKIDEKNLNTDTLKIFKQEFEVMTRLKHSHLARVFNFGFDLANHEYYITMEYIEGLSLKDILLSDMVIPQEQVVSSFINLCRVISFIHSRKIIHRDIKPNNIMLTKNHTVKLMDFGLADLGTGDKRKKGTLPYMAPEIFKGEADTQTDIFALGITFFELLNKQCFYNNYTSQNIFSMIRNSDQFYKHREIMLGQLLNPDLYPIIKKMTAYDVGNRYKNCMEIIVDLNEALGTHYPLETNETKEAYVLGAGFVGRDNELEKLKKHVKEPGESFYAFWIQGEAGIGKSRLFLEFKNWCQLHSIAFLEGTCFDTLNILFGPFLVILNELLLHAGSQQIQQYGPELKKILPYHESLHDIAPGPVHDPQTERSNQIRTIVQCLIDITYTFTHGCVLYLNDMHWSDEGSIEVVNTLLREMQFRTEDGGKAVS